MHQRRRYTLGEFEFQQLLESLPAGAYTCDAEGLITYYNQRAIDLWGRAPQLNDPADRFCGSFKLFAVDGTPIRHDQCWMALALRNNRPYLGEEILVERPDGRRLTALAHANPIHDSAGQVVGAVNVLVDISDRKSDEEARRLLAAIVESSDDAIISKSFDGHILSWNAGAERIFGYTAAEAIGSHITLIIPQEMWAEEDMILARLRRGERIEHYETVRVTKQGRRKPVSLTISPLRDGTGRVVGASKIARDVSAKKQAEGERIALKDELSSQLSDLRRLHGLGRRLSATLELERILDETLGAALAIEGTSMGIVSLSGRDDPSLRVSASRGLDAEFLQTIDRLPSGRGARGSCYMTQQRVIVTDVETDPLFEDYRDAARRAGFRAVHCTPLVTRSGKIVGVLSTYFRWTHQPSDREMHLIDLCVRQATDCIENARLYDQLRETDQRKDEFLAILGHELRNPLAALRSALDILRLSDDASPAVELVRDVMDGQVNQLVRLVDDLMEVSRITRGKIELRKEQVDLASVTRSAVETSKPLIDAAGHQLAISLSPQPMTLEADPVRLAQVLTNLLNNAAKYTEQGGQIWLTARREDDEAVVSVRDTGLGIPEDMLPRVFEMFSQESGTRARSQGGLGLGLAVAKRLVEMHGGRIEAHSAGPGQGSEFVLRLPLVGPAPPLATAPTAAPTMGKPLPAHRVLIVDDSRDVVYTLGSLLRRMGQDVSTAADAAEALQQVRRERPDVVISDIGMPDIDGYQFARLLRNEPGMEGVVLVALTGYGQDSDRERALAAGFDRHLVKPGRRAAPRAVAGLAARARAI